MSISEEVFDNSANKDVYKKISCVFPFNLFHLDVEGNVASCCPSWMPTVAGRILKNSLLEIMEGAHLKDIRQSVTDGTFKYCDGRVCPSLINYVHNGTVQQPLIPVDKVKELSLKRLILSLDYDRSCNLYCGSCRNERLLYSLENMPEDLKKIHENTVRNVRELTDSGYDLTVQLTGSGDAFASPLYWNFLKNVTHDDKFKIRLTTNGTLMTAERLSLPYAQKVDHIEISVDAFTENTYNKVRRGGNFTALVKNMNDLNTKLEKGELKNLHNWKVNFIVQDNNFREMADFAHWTLSYSRMNMIWFNLINQWGHISNEMFSKKAIWSDQHPDHQEFLEILKDPVFDRPGIFLGNVAHYRHKALRRN